MAVLLLLLALAAFSSAATARPQAMAADVQAERFGADESETSELRPDFKGEVTQVASSFQAHMEAHGEGDIFRAGKYWFRCPCRNQVCDSTKYRLCVCSNCACFCRNK
ncbi:hypothetical protein L7F22_068978 [Adiantum nelumboides]|nr:hypothetical protein [Adiantum nelumboides]